MIHVICGAPCAGKSTYVRANASPNETVIDLDSMALSMGADKSHMATRAKEEKRGMTQTSGGN